MEAKSISLAIPMIEAKKFDEETRTEEIEFTNNPEFNSVIYSDNMRSIEMDFIAIDNEFVNPQHNYVMMLSAMMTSLLVKIYRKLAQQRSSISTSMLISGVIDYIQKNYAKDISNTSIGAEFNYHPNYINRSMLNSTGQSLHQYVISVRVLHALELIQTTDMSITEIAKDYIPLINCPHYCFYSFFLGKVLKKSDILHDIF
jgi:YesN/AraC family two-component response regulator